MSQEFHYYSRGGAFDVNLGTQAARLADYGGYSMKAEAGAIGNSTFIIDDPNGTVGYNNDGILGLKSFYVLETDCPPVGSNGIYGTRLYTGFFRERTYRRGTGSRSSLITGVAREIDATLEDLNSQASWSLITGTDSKRPAETDIARLQWLLGSKYLPARVYPGGSGPWTDWNEPGFIDTTNPVNMDANDYFGQDPGSVIHDAAVASGKDWWFGYWEATGHNFFWYAKSETSTNYTSPLQISNVLADVDNVTTFAPEPDAEMRRDPSKTFSGVLVQAAGVYSYQQNLTTGSNYAFRDGSGPNPNVKTQAQADAAAIRLLADAASEEDRITARVRLPSSLATGIKQGQRIATKLSFLPPPYGSNYNWWRVASLQVQQDEATDKRYTLSLELTPTNSLVCSTSVSGNVTAGTGWSTTGAAAPTVSTVSVSITPGLTGPMVLFGATFAFDTNTPNQTNYSPGASYTLLDKVNWSGTNTERNIGVEYRAVASPSGSYTVDASFENGYMDSIIDPTINKYDQVALAMRLTGTTPVQFTHEHVDSGTGNMVMTLAATPTVGNVLIMCLCGGTSNPGPNTPGPGTSGWTQLYQASNGTGGHSIWARCVQPGDGAAWNSINQSDFMSGVLFEWAP